MRDMKRCPDCMGEGVEDCWDCDGLGMCGACGSECDTCYGSGEEGECPRCEGSGLVPITERELEAAGQLNAFA